MASGAAAATGRLHSGFVDNGTRPKARRRYSPHAFTRESKEAGMDGAPGSFHDRFP